MNAMKKASELLKNLVYATGYFRPTIKEGFTVLKLYAKDLEVFHIKVDYPDQSTWRKKKYFERYKEDICSKLDEWIFQNLIDQNEYSDYLERYRPQKDRGDIDDIDEYIMNKHYRPKAIKKLQNKKSFDLIAWTKKRTHVKYERRFNLNWKNGDTLNFDYRNSIQSLFIRRTHDDKEVIAVSGSGSSGQRCNNTYYTVIFYMLSKKVRIPHYLILYNGFNEFEYVGRRYRAVLTPGFGSNFDIDKRLIKEIQRKGVYWD